MSRLVLALTLVALLLSSCGRADTAQTPVPITETPSPYPTETTYPTLTPTMLPFPTFTPTAAVPGDPALLAELNGRVLAAEQAWQNSQIASYRLTLLEIHSIWSAQRLTLTVSDGLVVDIQSMCIPAPTQGKTCTIQPFEPANYLVPALLAQAHDLITQQRPEYVKLDFDPVLGYPTMIGFDDPQIMDEDYGIRVEKFEQLPGRPASELGTTIRLRVGETAQVDGYTIELLQIVQDSRCPRTVNCVRAGEVVVELRISAPNAPPELFQLMLVGNGLPPADPTEVAGKRIQLTSVSPYPAAPAPIPSASYVITLQVS